MPAPDWQGGGGRDNDVLDIPPNALSHTLAATFWSRATVCRNWLGRLPQRRAELGKNHPNHRNSWMWSTLKHSQVWECQSGEEVILEDGPTLSWNTGGGEAEGRQEAKLKMADVTGARSAYRVSRV